VSQHPDVVVIGGGAIGCAIAWRLAQAGAAVKVLERAELRHSATWAAAGMLSPFGEVTHPSFLELTNASRDLYDSFISELTEASGVNVEFGAPGKLEFAFTDGELTRLQQKHSPVLRRESALALEPAVSPVIAGAVLYPRDAFVDNRALGQALAAAAERAGATLRWGASASALDFSGSTLRGVVLESGERIGCTRVVLCAGAWSAQLTGVAWPLPVTPVKGQMVALRSRLKLRHMLQYAHCYIIPRSHNRVLVGATVERVGFDAKTTTQGVESMLSAARELVPGLADAELLEAWTGFRPGTPDDLPILGAEPMLAGLVYATGHYRNGILLAPITAQLITELITGATPALPLEAFSVQRFRDESNETTVAEKTRA
jgi:glycine oxidase